MDTHDELSLPVTVKLEKDDYCTNEVYLRETDALLDEVEVPCVHSSVDSAADEVEVPCDDLFVSTAIKTEKNDCGITEVYVPEVACKWSENEMAYGPRLMETGNTDLEVGLKAEVMSSDTESDDEIVIIDQIKTPKKGTNRSIRKRCCIFCEKWFSQIEKHLLTHREEKEVKRIRALAPQSKTRVRLLLNLVERGERRLRRNRWYDSILNDQPSTHRNKRYLSCPNCQGAILSKKFSYHLRSCFSQKLGYLGATSARANRFRLSDLKASEKLKEVLILLCADEVTKIILEDPLIIMFGEIEVARCDLTESQSYYGLRDQLRALGTYVKIYREVLSRSCTTLEATFHPEELAKLEEVARRYSSNYQNPESLDLLKAALVVILHLDSQRVRGQSWLDKFTLCWREKVQPNITRAKTAQRETGTRSISEIPHSYDLTKLCDHIFYNVNEWVDAKITKYHEYCKLCTYVVASITLFNLGRRENVARMRINDFRNRRKGSEVLPAERLHLTKTELKIIDDMELVIIEDKRVVDQSVIACLQPNMVEAIKKVMRVRYMLMESSRQPKLRMLQKNTRMFATVDGEDTYFCGHTCVEEVVNECSLEKPFLITAPHLHKYIVAQMQWLCIGDSQRLILSKYLRRKLKLAETILDQQMQATLYYVIPVMLAVIDENVPVPKGIDFSRLSNEDVELFIGRVCYERNAQNHSSAEDWILPENANLDDVQQYHHLEFSSPAAPMHSSATMLSNGELPDGEVADIMRASMYSAGAVSSDAEFPEGETAGIARAPLCPVVAVSSDEELPDNSVVDIARTPTYSSAGVSSDEKFETVGITRAASYPVVAVSSDEELPENEVADTARTPTYLCGAVSSNEESSDNDVTDITRTPTFSVGTVSSDEESSDGETADIARVPVHSVGAESSDEELPGNEIADVARTPPHSSRAVSSDKQLPGHELARIPTAAESTRMRLRERRVR